MRTPSCKLCGYIECLNTRVFLWAKWVGVCTLPGARVINQQWLLEKTEQALWMD
jgi:hypothetical protein